MYTSGQQLPLRLMHESPNPFGDAPADTTVALPGLYMAKTGQQLTTLSFHKELSAKAHPKSNDFCSLRVNHEDSQRHQQGYN